MIKSFFTGLFKFYDKHQFLTFVLWTAVTIFPINWVICSSIETCYPNHSKYFYVSDFSSVLNTDTEEFIIREAEKLENLTRAQVVVATVPEINAASLEYYSLTLANQWGIGDSKLDNGILILFNTDPKNKKVRLEIGKGLEGDIPDSKAGRILDDYVVTSKNEGLWNIAARNAFVGVGKELYRIYKMEPPPELQFMYREPARQKGPSLADVPFEMSPENEYAPGFGTYFVTYLISLFFSAISYLIAFVGILSTIIESIDYGLYRSSNVYRIVGSGGSGSSGSGRSSSGRSYRSSGSRGGGRRSGGGGHFGGGGASR